MLHHQLYERKYPGKRTRDRQQIISKEAIAIHHLMIIGDVRAGLKVLPGRSIHSCITSPPYWMLRDYGHPCQLGLEPSPDEYVANMVEVFREVRRVLHDDGTLWLNLGDCYSLTKAKGPQQDWKGTVASLNWSNNQSNNFTDLPSKNLVGIPWRVAFALQADGWYLRSDIIWHKPNPMPESVTDRPTRAHEYIFLLSKSERYFYDAEAIKEQANPKSNLNFERSGLSSNLIIPNQSYSQHRKSRSGSKVQKVEAERGRSDYHLEGAVPWEGCTRNKRSVWSVTTSKYSGAHFATFPPKLIEPCIKAGCPKKGTVLDPFGGSGTVTMVAEQLDRNSIYIDISPEYAEMARRRCGFVNKMIDTASYEIMEVC